MTAVLVFARLVDASLAGALTPEADLLMRRRAAAVVHALGEEGAQETAGLFALPALPVLLASGGHYGAAWLLWWQRQGGARLPVRPSPAWCAGLTIALLTLRVHSSVHEPTPPRAAGRESAGRPRLDAR